MTGRAQRYGNLENVIGNGKGGIGGAVDSTTGSLNVQRTDDPRFDDVSDLVLVNEDDLAVGTHHFPDANGVAQLGYKSLSIEGKLRSGTAGETLTLSIQGTNGFEWRDVIGPFIDETGSSPITSPLSSVTNATDNFAASWDHFPYQKWRIIVVVTGTTSDNEAKVASYQKAL